MAKKTLILAVMILSAIAFVTANGVGNEIEKIVNGFSFEFGIDPKIPIANEKTTMSLSVHNASTGKALRVEDLWIRISKANEILFTSSDFRITEYGPMFFGYIFKESGNYTIDFSFKQDSKNIDANFNVDVEGSNQNLLKNIAALIVIFVFGYITAKLLNQKKNKGLKK